MGKNIVLIKAYNVGDISAIKELLDTNTPYYFSWVKEFIKTLL